MAVEAGVLRRPERLRSVLLGSWLNRLVLGIMRQSPFIRDAVKNQIAWEKRLGEA